MQQKRILLCPLEYGYTEDEDGDGLIPIITSDEPMPKEFPKPCSCLKCAFATVCSCRVKGILCCDFCQCKAKCNYTNTVPKVAAATATS